MGMRIWIDADSTPRDARDVVYRASERLGIGVTLVSIQPMTAPDMYRLVTAISIASTFDGVPGEDGAGAREAAEAYVAEQAEAGDLVVTREASLAARFAGKDVVVLDERGAEHDLRSDGIVTRGPPPFDAKAKREFAGGLDRTLTRMLQSRNGLRP